MSHEFMKTSHFGHTMDLQVISMRLGSVTFSVRVRGGKASVCEGGGSS
jgi:hypothetical protein